ncbi:hypothetical protein SISSUDRAFT_1116289 [Sistotremastrum suecicum HHB10207 ss-3]|uniref:DUF6699 domain-containing protein n=1 Tax=Sistotremastrum suecicum HHB10207 ss-3 TaxID=1314776 RepID=A0A166IBU5_9AGAM|nr:hypothetical protein SISSUDRAFT_1116289 [Sistotremastrum suecicum HHB10207 ss-3]
MLNFLHRDPPRYQNSRQYPNTVPYAGLPYGGSVQPYYDRPAPSQQYDPRRRSWPDGIPGSSYGGIDPSYGYGHFPQIHELLAANTSTLLVDMRTPVHDQLRSSANAMHFEHYAMPATQSGATTVRIVSKEFPWSFDIKSGSGGPVTVSDLLQGIYIGLQGRLTDTEWAGADEVRKRAIERANASRRGMPVVDRAKRVDWLGHRIFFAGLVHDEAFASRSLAPGRHPVPETWVVRFRG